MDFTTLVYIKIQFEGDWKQQIAPAKYIAAFDPEPAGTALGVRVVTDSPGVGPQTYNFLVADRVNVSTQGSIINIPGICTGVVKGDEIGCRD